MTKVLHGHGNFYDENNVLCPTWTQLRYEMHTWQLPEGETASWWTTFVVCVQRYFLKLLRTRKRIYMLLLVTSLLGALCGALHGDNPSSNDLILFVLLFNTLFGSIVSTSTITSLGGESAENLFLHEAASGVMQTAEVAARLLLDLIWPLSLLAISFALPLKGLATLPIPLVRLLINWWLISFAMSPIGYVFTLIAPGNAIVLTSSATLVTCAFGTGFFGIKMKSLPGVLKKVFPWLSPGCPSLFLIGVGSAINRPLSVPRAVLLNAMMSAGLLEKNATTNILDDVQMQESNDAWATDITYPGLLQLLTFGCVLRLLTIVLFYCRSNTIAARLSNRLRDRRQRKQRAETVVVAPPLNHSIVHNESMWNERYSQVRRSSLQAPENEVAQQSTLADSVEINVPDANPDATATSTVPVQEDSRSPAYRFGSRRAIANNLARIRMPMITPPARASSNDNVTTPTPKRPGRLSAVSSKFSKTFGNLWI